MTTSAGKELNVPRRELVFGLVGAMGTDMDLVEQELSRVLETLRYRVIPLRLSTMLGEIPHEPWNSIPPSPAYEHRKAQMDCGDELRRKLNYPPAVASLAVSAIRRLRNETEEKNEQSAKLAFILRSLKHPAEVDLVRTVYGESFLLISAYCPKDQRVSRVAEEFARSHYETNSSLFLKETLELVDRDEKDLEKGKHGQNTRDTFPEADLFIDASNGHSIRKSIERFLELSLGHPFHTPTRDEYCMFFAQAAALRSADLSRQVGAVICDSDGNLIALGTNDVPRPRGGQYWTGDIPDVRDFQVGRDANAEHKQSIAVEVLRLLQSDGWLSTEGTQAFEKLISEHSIGSGGLPFGRSRLMSLIEFGRAVHAEMAAFMDAARRGISVSGGVLYTTTFPCHDCARHIIAAGISRVVYIEPYPKSLAITLYPEAISVDPTAEGQGKVVFEPFVGIAPKKYIELFTAPDRKNDNGEARFWNPEQAEPRWANRVSPGRVLFQEDDEFDRLNQLCEDAQIPLS